MTNVQISSEVHTADFNIGFMLMMLQCGRTEEAMASLQKAQEALAELKAAFPKPE